jgi:signal transduction histidine kinase
MWNWQNTFSRASIARAIAIGGAAILIGVTILVVAYQQSTYRMQKLQEVAAQSDVLAASVTAALVFDDAKAAQEYVSALKAYPELNVAAVYDGSDHLVASIARVGLRAVPKHVQARAPYYADNQIFVAKPVFQNGSAVGKVYLSVTVDSALQRFVRYSGIILLVTMAVLLMSVLAVMQQALTRTNLKLQTEMAERVKVEEALRQSHKMEALGQLAGGVAHDFNNLLAIIKGSLQLMERRLGPMSLDVKKFMDAALDGVGRAATVTQRILAFTRRQNLTQEEISLSDVVRNTLELVHQSVGRDIEVETDLNANWLTMCDVNQMENAILNLTINARDAMPNGGKLTIQTANVHGSTDGTQGGDYVLLRVSDTGTGMSEDVRQRALDPFFTTKPQGKGTGLGLSMTLGFVNQSNGQLQIESKEGQGTAVSILMPRVTA